MQPRDIYLRHTSTTGSSYVQQHRVWDADRFIAGAQSEAAKANAEVKDGSGKAKAEQITEDQYHHERRATR